MFHFSTVAASVEDELWAAATKAVKEVSDNFIARLFSLSPSI